VVVLTGTAKAFSAGADLKDREGRDRGDKGIGALRRQLRIGPRLTRAWHEMEQVTIGAIEGFCIGGGAALAVALDFASWAAAAHIGSRDRARHEHELAERAAHAALMGPARHQAGVIIADEKVSAQEAYEWRLFEQVVDDGKTFEAAWCWRKRSRASRRFRSR